ncbi:J domain-containing protein [Phytopseudomonas dryadis]|uniref:J domain-containing protein n=1 Tax=Pseudomonadaceae TaxID=135621 RepID=UPI00103716CE|nr:MULTISPECIES: J domain-containing protein [Pseudomonas]
MSPWQLLGLDAEADTRSIKRRYAQLLKQHRPDEDPEAFQRLREAYEYAIEWASQEVPEPASPPELDQPSVVVVPEPFGNGQRAFVPLSATQEAHLDEQARIAFLIDTCESLDIALLDAREANLEREFQLELVRRCEERDERALEILRWAMARLDWLTPWQADYLPPVAMAQLAQRLLEVELAELRASLPVISESRFHHRVYELARQKWLRPLELNRQLQQALVPILERYEQASVELIERLERLFGWSEQDGYLPCDGERWAALLARLASEKELRMLRALLAVSQPQTPEQRAAWFLFRPMSNGQRRRMADGFGEQDWQACQALAATVRMPHRPSVQGVLYFPEWRQWRPREWGAFAALYAWLLTALVLLINQAYRPSAADGQSLLRDGLLALVASAVTIALLSLLRRGWGWMARRLASLDVWLSRFILPAGVWRQGAGLLLIRHLLPATMFALLVGAWAKHVPWAAALAMMTLIGSVCFLAAVTAGASPTGWWTLLRRGIGGRAVLMLMLWLAIIVGGTLLAGLVGPEVRKSYPQRATEGRADLLKPCARPADAQQRHDCDDAARMVGEALQRAEGRTP